MESSEQANNQKRKISEKIAEKRKMESSEQANNRKRKIAEKNGKRRKNGKFRTSK
jgi:hypothetical protein